MTAIHTQVSAMTPQSVGESKDDYLERIERTSIVVQRHLAHLTIAAMVVDSQKNTSATERIVQTALKEGPTHPLSMLLQQMYKNSDRAIELRMFREALTTGHSTRERAVMFNMDTQGSHAHTDIVRHLGLTLRHDLKDMLTQGRAVGTDPQGIPSALLSFLSEVDRANALGASTLNWTSNYYAEQVASRTNMTPRGMSPLVTHVYLEEKKKQVYAKDNTLQFSLSGAVQNEQSANQAALTRANNATYQSSPTGLAGVIKAVLDGNGLVQALKTQDIWDNARRTIAGANLDTTGLKLVEPDSTPVDSYSMR